MIQFDAYLVVDWSARNQPSPALPCKDALWVGQGAWNAAGNLATRESYWTTREQCMRYVREQLAGMVEQGRCVLAGFDFPYGYPAGYAGALGVDGPQRWVGVWQAIAGEVQDRPDNQSNRFDAAAALNRRCGERPGPLWGCPVGRRDPHLSSRAPGFPFRTDSGALLQRLRHTDRAALRRQPGLQEGWKLYGSGSVGSQALTGIPRLLQLRYDPALAPVSRVWPFETGFTPSPTPDHGPFILHAEIWPSLARTRLNAGIPVRDQAQVRALVEWAADEDVLGTLARAFDRPEGLDAEVLQACVEEEGWILRA